MALLALLTDCTLKADRDRSTVVAADDLKAGPQWHPAKGGGGSLEDRKEPRANSRKKPALARSKQEEASVTDLVQAHW